MGAAEFGFGEHAADGVLNDALGALFEHFAEGGLAEAAEVSGVAVVDFLLEFASGDGDFGGVEDDDVVAEVLGGVVGGFMFAAEEAGDLGGEASEGAVGGVDHVPAALDAMRVEDGGGHGWVSIRGVWFDRSERRLRSNPLRERLGRRSRVWRR